MKTGFNAAVVFGQNITLYRIKYCYVHRKLRSCLVRVYILQLNVICLKESTIDSIYLILTTLCQHNKLTKNAIIIDVLIQGFHFKMKVQVQNNPPKF